jgi:hypothetical protein
MQHGHVVGEVFHWPFNRDGNFLYDHIGLTSTVPNSANAWQTLDPTLRNFFERTYTMKWSDLTRKTRQDRAIAHRHGRPTTTIAVAGGAAKHEAIWIALSKLPPAIDILVTDADTLDYLASQIRACSA